jgi:hypothetical protein
MSKRMLENESGGPLGVICKSRNFSGQAQRGGNLEISKEHTSDEPIMSPGVRGCIQ